MDEPKLQAFSITCLHATWNHFALSGALAYDQYKIYWDLFIGKSFKLLDVMLKKIYKKNKLSLSLYFKLFLCVHFVILDFFWGHETWQDNHFCFILSIDS